MVTFGDVHQQMSGKNSNWLSDIKQCIHYKEPGLDCTLIIPFNILYKKLLSQEYTWELLRNPHGNTYNLRKDLPQCLHISTF